MHMPLEAVVWQFLIENQVVEWNAALEDCA